MTPPHNQPTPSSTKNSAVALANKRMLLVEDNESIARTMLLLLTLLKIKVLHAGSGDEAYAILQHDQSFDAVLSDIQMPGSIDGHTLALKVRQEFPAIHVVLMTGFNDTGSEVPDFTLLQKPFNITKLTDCLAKLLLSRSPV